MNSEIMEGCSGRQWDDFGLTSRSYLPVKTKPHAFGGVQHTSASLKEIMPEVYV